MPIDEGGLNYQINVSGNFDQRIKEFKAAVADLERRSAALPKAPKAPRVTPGSAGDPKGAQLVLEANKKIASLKKQQRLADNKTVRLEQTILDLKNRQNKAERASLLSQNAEMRAKTASAVASKKILDTDQKSLNTVEAIAKARAAGKSSIEEISKFTGINKKQLEQTDALLGKQAEYDRDHATALKENSRREQQAIRRTQAAQSRQAAAIERAHSAAINEDNRRNAAAERQRRANDIQLQAQNRIDQSNREMLIKKAQIKKLTDGQVVAGKKIVMTQRQAANQVGLTAAQAKQLGLKMWDAQHAASQFLFTFRRLVGILAVFTLARKLSQWIAAGVKEMITFNEKLELAQINISKIIISLGEVRTSSGELAEGPEKFTAAMEVSRGVLDQLRKDAIGSVASFEGMVRAFQSGIGPGLAAGLNVDQVKEVTNGLAEAAATIGLPINQLDEEIRSLIQGTARARDTRLAVLFGGAKELNKQVRAAKEAGDVYGYFKEKLDELAPSSLATANSMAVLKSDLQDAFQVVAKEGGAQLFETLKNSIRGLRDLLADTSGDEAVISPEALGVAKETGRILSTIVESFSEFIDAKKVLKAVEGVLATVADVLAVVLPLVGAFADAIFTAFNAVAEPLRFVVDSLKAILTFLAGDGKIVRGIRKVVVITAAWYALLVLATKAIIAMKLAGLASSMAAAVGPAIAFATSLWNGVAALVVGNVQMSALLVKAIKTTLALGGIPLLIGLIVGAIALLLNKFGVFDKVLGGLKKTLRGTALEADKLRASVSSATGETLEAAKGTDDWRKNMEDLVKEAEKLDLLGDLQGDARVLADALIGVEQSAAKAVKRLKDLKDASVANREEARRGLVANAKANAKLKERLAAEEATLEALKKKRRAYTDTKNVYAEIRDQKSLIKGTQDEINGAEDVRFRRVQEIRDAEASVLSIESKLLDVQDQAAEMKQAEVTAAISKRTEAQRNLIIAKKESEVSRATTMSLGQQFSKTRNLLVGAEDLLSVRQAEFDLAEASARQTEEKFLGEKSLLAKYLQEAEALKDLAVAEALQGDITEEVSQQKISAIDETVEALRNEAEQQIYLANLSEQLAKSKVTAAQQAVSKALVADSGTVLAGFRQGLLELAQGLPTAAQSASKIIQSAVTDLADIASESLVDIFSGAAARDERRQKIDIERQRKDLNLQRLRAEITEEEFQNQIAALNAQEDAIATATDKFFDAMRDFFRQFAEEFVSSILKDLAKSALLSIAPSLLPQAAANAPSVALGATQALDGDTPGKIAAGLEGIQTATVTGFTKMKAGMATLGSNLLVGLQHGWSLLSTGFTAIISGMVKLALGMWESVALMITNMYAAIAPVIAGLAIQTGAMVTAIFSAIAPVLAFLVTGLLPLLASFFATALGYLATTAVSSFIPFFKDGGKVSKPKAFAEGGEAGIPRPSYIPASDTVPAWLTPGEFVMKKDAVARYGSGLLNSMNSGAASAKTVMGKVRGYADGGLVGNSIEGALKGLQNLVRFDDDLFDTLSEAMAVQVAERSSGQGGGGGGQGVGGNSTTVLPVLPATNATVGQLLTGGRKSFTNAASQVPFIGNPNGARRW